jgi:signal transduction histidine kinase
VGVLGLGFGNPVYARWAASAGKRMGSTLAIPLRKLSNFSGCGHPAVEAQPGEEARLVAKLAQAVRARDEFIAIAAHELRNPMTPILGYVEHILAVSRRSEINCPPAIAASLERLVGVIDHYIERATTLLNVSRITAGKLRTELSMVDPPRPQDTRWTSIRQWQSGQVVP